MILKDIEARASLDALDIAGHLQTNENDDLEHGTIVLFSPKEPGFWDIIQASPEMIDGDPDPIDRWSARIIGRMAQEFQGQALFPFGHPPRPFINWCLRSNSVWQSPVQLLVHNQMGLWVSFRGAVFFPGIEFETVSSTPACESCETLPCLTACPASAISTKGYDLDACHRYLDTPDGADCLERGCAVRRSCPASKNYSRLEAQSAYHMERFHPWR